MEITQIHLTLLSNLLATGEIMLSWSYDYAFSVDLDPSTGGEHVQAGFSS